MPLSNLCSQLVCVTDLKKFRTSANGWDIADCYHMLYVRASPAAPPTRPPGDFLAAGAEKSAQSRPRRPFFRRLGPKLVPADLGRTRRAGGAQGRQGKRFWHESLAGPPSQLSGALVVIIALVSHGESMPRLSHCRAGQPSVDASRVTQ